MATAYSQLNNYKYSYLNSLTYNIMQYGLYSCGDISNVAIVVATPILKHTANALINSRTNISCNYVKSVALNVKIDNSSLTNISSYVIKYIHSAIISQDYLNIECSTKKYNYANCNINSLSSVRLSNNLLKYTNVKIDNSTTLLLNEISSKYCSIDINFTSNLSSNSVLREYCNFNIISCSNLSCNSINLKYILFYTAYSQLNNYKYSYLNSLTYNIIQYGLYPCGDISSVAIVVATPILKYSANASINSRTNTSCRYVKRLTLNALINSETNTLSSNSVLGKYCNFNIISCSNLNCDSINIKYSLFYNAANTNLSTIALMNKLNCLIISVFPNIYANSSIIKSSDAISDVNSSLAVIPYRKIYVSSTTENQSFVCSNSYLIFVKYSNVKIQLISNIDGTINLYCPVKASLTISSDLTVDKIQNTIPKEIYKLKISFVKTYRNTLDINGNVKYIYNDYSFINKFKYIDLQCLTYNFMQHSSFTTNISKIVNVIYKYHTNINFIKDYKHNTKFDVLSDLLPYGYERIGIIKYSDLQLMRYNELQSITLAYVLKLELSFIMEYNGVK